MTVLPLFCRTAHAQPSSLLRLSEYQKQEWQVEDGLPDNYVRMITQRADGLLLLATSSGLSTFDGQRFKNAPIDLAGLVDNEAVNAVLPLSTSDLWIGTDGRGVLHATNNGVVQVSEQYGHHSERIRMFHLDAAGVVWVATQNGVERIVNGRPELIAGTGMISGDITTPFAEDGRGGMFFVTSLGLYHWQDGIAQRFSLGRSVHETAVAVYRDARKRIWVGTMARLVELVPHKCVSCGSALQYDPVVRATVGNPITVLLGDAAGSLWIGTRHDGIWRLAADGLSHWGSHDGLPDDSIRTLFIDDEQNLWIGMLTGGLSRWHKGALAPFGEPEGFKATYAATAFTDSHGDLWLGTWGQGLFRRHGEKLLSVTPPGMPPSTPIRAIAEDRKQQIWIGTWFDGIYRFDGRSYHHYLLGNESPGNAVSSILVDERGGLWVGSYTGLFYFPRGEPDSQHRALFLESQLITCMVQDKDGSLVIGTTNGLYRIRGDVVTAIQGLDHPHILSLALDSSGYVWAGIRSGGLAAVREDHFIALSADSNAPTAAVNTITEDKDGHLWLGTFRGIVRLSVAELHAVVDKKRTQLSAVILGKTDGMRSSECGGPSQPSSTILPDGTLWFATTKGFVHTTDAAEKLGAISPVATITGWSLSSDPDTTQNIAASGSFRIDLEAGQPDAFFLFNAKQLTNPARIEYRYRLTGYDSEWTTTHSHTARYRRLTPGNYSFEVQARASGEEWTSPIASIAVRQRPFFYQTWYFYLTLCLLAAFVILQLLRHRIELLKGRLGIVVEERNRIARECHDTLMAGFAAISWQLEATAKLFRDTDSSATPAAQSCELARSMVSHCQAEARRIIWDLRGTDEVTDILSQALGRALAADSLQQGIETTFKVEGDELPLAPGCVHHLVCIGQEAVSNAVHHASPSHIFILLKYDLDALSLSIHDNGRGFQDSEPNPSRSGHFGIPVMEERARKLGGTFRLQTSAEAGTEVTVKVSFSAMRQPLQQEHNVIRWIGI
ncbi:sensor histidine kinase [Granulicella arctica]|uniref:sensor histidine kinase n=1 Tax=Granulicella arctica TaxID=940613 RepID=UPI0021E05BFC|nr:sensor histidine kinase [Granulicella arctica]